MAALTLAAIKILSAAAPEPKGVAKALALVGSLWMYITAAAFAVDGANLWACLAVVFVPTFGGALLGQRWAVDAPAVVTPAIKSAAWLCAIGLVAIVALTHRAIVSLFTFTAM